jgi:hypothetical protein
MAAKTLWCPSCAINVKSDSWSQIRREKRNSKVVYLHQKCNSLLSLRTETSKECPVCHTVGLGNYLHNRPEREEATGLLYGRWHRRFENEPCGTCISQIADNIKRIAEIDAEKANLAEYRLNRSPRLDFSFAADFQRRDEAAKAFYALLFAVTEGTRRRIHSSEGLETVPLEPPNGSGDANRAEWVGRMTPEAAAAFQGLYEMFVEFTEGAYAKGKERGQNILLQLKSGEIGLADFNEQVERRR